MLGLLGSRRLGRDSTEKSGGWGSVRAAATSWMGVAWSPARTRRHPGVGPASTAPPPGGRRSAHRAIRRALPMPDRQTPREILSLAGKLDKDVIAVRYRGRSVDLHTPI